MSRSLPHFAAGLLLCAALPLHAQVTPSGGSVRRLETRAQLEGQIARADSEKRASEAWLLRQRLQKGDFQEGDRIVLVLESNPAAVDTLQVQAGKVIQLPRMGEVSLEGVLRSELSDTLRHHLSRYLTNPGVRATPLLPIGVLGTVTNPGYYYTRADVVLRDVIMRAGGPRPEADLKRIEIRRGTEVIWRAQDVSVALADGISLDRLHLRAGDELHIPAARRLQLNSVLAVVSATVAITLAITQIQR